ncbi:hypothetical protein HMPREF0864_04783 [Enterobacteriaceae bacterium 9_2_54FAA]|nr:hypothetical protein HMPREF0864_04783 [Enterobacteriaceae bacterium 9_2_54FAA]
MAKKTIASKGEGNMIVRFSSQYYFNGIIKVLRNERVLSPFVCKEIKCKL